MPPHRAEPIVLAVSGNPEGFPGYGTFWRNAGHVGIDPGMCLVVDTSQPMDVVGETLGGSNAQLAICLGAESFYALTGIKKRIESTRGYFFEPSDCRPLEIRSREQVGLYKTTRKRDGETIHSVGDPKYGTVIRNQKQTLPKDLRFIVPTLNPRSIEEARFKTLPALKADLQHALGSLTPSFKLLDVSFSELPFQTVGTSGIVAFDIETTGLGGPVDRIGVATGAGTWSARWNSHSKATFQAILDGGATLLIGHNLAFDIPRLEAAGVVFPDVPLFDTMLGAHLIQPDLYKALEKVASLYLCLRPWKHLNVSNPAEYNATDATVTLYLAEKMLSILADTGMYDLFTGTMMPALRTLMNLTKRGLKVDRIRLGAWQQELGEKFTSEMATWSQLHPAVNPNSPKQIQKLLYEDLVLPTQYERTKEGMKITTDEAALTILRPQAPDTIDALLAVKKTHKLRSVYSEVEMGSDFAIHPNYLPASKDTDDGAAASGRLAASDPNIQNQPDEARKLFVPSIESGVFLEWDYSQIELRIAAARSEDRYLIAALNDPEKDVHAHTMELVGCDRTRAKNLMYGSLYGAGPRKLASVLRKHGQSVSESECRSLQARMAASYPGLWAWRYRVIAEGTTLGYLTNAFGRRRYFYDRYRDADGVLQSGSVPEMLAFLPSSDAADILWSRLVPLESLCEEFDGHLVTTVHDSFLMEFPSDNVGRDLVRSLRSTLECEFPNIASGFRCPGNLKMGSNWGEMTKLIL